jgi:hypothetical protein
VNVIYNIVFVSSASQLSTQNELLEFNGLVSNSCLILFYHNVVHKRVKTPQLRREKQITTCYMIVTTSKWENTLVTLIQNYSI